MKLIENKKKQKTQITNVIVGSDGGGRAAGGTPALLWRRGNQG
jgi:hypothetical protein